MNNYIRSQKMEVRAVLLTEFDEEKFKRVSRRNGVREGREEKAIEAAVLLIKEYNELPEVAAQKMNAPLEKVLELQKDVTVQA